MEIIFWVLLIIVIVIGILASILLSRLYAAIRDNVSQAIKDIRADLDDNKELIRRVNLDYSAKYSTQDAEPYGQKARIYQEELKKAHDRIAANDIEFRRIRHSLSREGKDFIDRTLNGMRRGVRLYQADRDLFQLRQSIPRHGGNLREVEQSLQALDRLPVEIADLSKYTRELCLETKSILNELSLVEGVSGKAMEESTRTVGEIEKSLELISPIFNNSTPDELLATQNIKAETQKAYRSLKPSGASLEDLNKKVKGWKSNLEELRRTAQVMDEKMQEAESMFSQLDQHLILSGEKEELDALCQNADEVNANLAALTGENISPTLGEARQALGGLVDLTRSFTEYEDNLGKLQTLATTINGQIETIENTMMAAASRQEYPLIWTNSRSALEDIKGKFTFIPAMSERRTPEELGANVLTAEACNASLAKLTVTINRVVTNLDQLAKIWDQLRPAYTETWLKEVEELYARVSVFDMDNNWDPADQSKTLLSDAEVLKKRADENIPSTSSIPVYEQQVESRLQIAEDLAEKKPEFEARKSRIEVEFGKIQSDERDAIGIFKRIAPAMTVFVQRIRSINVPTKSAQALLAADVTKKELEKSLRERNVGKVSRKLEEVRRWEKSTGEYGAQVYKWMEDDLRKRRESLGTSLNEIKNFADDLEDDLVLKAHLYDEDMAMKYQYTVNLVEKKPLDEVQNQFAELFKQWQEVVDCQSELITFITPLRDEYSQIVVDLNNLRANSSRLESELKREWPPIFRDPTYVRMKLDDQEQAIGRIKTIKWKRNDLRKCYLDTWQKLRDLSAEVEKLRSLDKQESDEMTQLEQEYKNKVREFARSVYDGNDAGIRKEIETGDNFLKSLVDQYKNGRRNGTNDPSAVEVRARLQRKIEAYRQQIVDYNINRMDVHWVDKERSSKPVEVDIPLPINKSDFNRNIDRLIVTLRKLPNPSLDVEDAIQYLQSAQQEAAKVSPDQRKIKQDLHSAKGALDTEKSVPEAATVIADISFLTKILNNIFG